MSVPSGMTVTLEMNSEHFRRFTQLGEDSGITDPSQLFTFAIEFFEKCARARMQGYLIGSCEGDAEAGKKGIVEILLSHELLALEASRAAGVVIQ
jgi:hypothetical protein